MTAAIATPATCPAPRPSDEFGAGMSSVVDGSFQAEESAALAACTKLVESTTSIPLRAPVAPIAWTAVVDATSPGVGAVSLETDGILRRSRSDEAGPGRLLCSPTERKEMLGPAVTNPLRETEAAAVNDASGAGNCPDSTGGEAVARVLFRKERHGASALIKKVGAHVGPFRTGPDVGLGVGWSSFGRDRGVQQHLLVLKQKGGTLFSKGYRFYVCEFDHQRFELWLEGQRSFRGITSRLGFAWDAGNVEDEREEGGRAGETVETGECKTRCMFRRNGHAGAWHDGAAVAARCVCVVFE
ncbi:hypothetical protein E4U42_007077 [Claviceps africana]|uniref:Uncharacterized protein n=1 Tax=Claviceps africana TaxID=83212 RepID=A0A8K0J2F5_9HYPO|nr:hypothetical protein E4U42_007077 [Claviceps africana]